MLLHRFENGDTLVRRGNAVIASFLGKRKVLSTAPYNGGCREDLKWVFNHNCMGDGDTVDTLRAPTYGEHMALVAQSLGLDAARSAGLSTAASMENLSIKSEAYKDTRVTAAVTAGIDVNGGRVGDIAQWHETDGEFVTAPGTVNILLFIEADLSEGALARALVTCTEAKTAALQELLAPSRFSNGIATGSGTDGVILVCDAQSPVKLTWAGKHAKLGELIGHTVITAVKEALFLQSGLCAKRQFHAIERISRFGVTEALLWEAASPAFTREAFLARLGAAASKSETVACTSLYVHLMDQLQWGLLEANDALFPARELLKIMDMGGYAPCGETADEALKSMAECYLHGFAAKLLSKENET